jgi:tetratricopeptide (TPR) repeat protein
VRYGDAEFKKSKEGKTLEIACRGNIALCKMKKGDWDGVIDNCEKIVESDPKNWKAFYRMAQALHKKDSNSAQAKKFAEQALEISP